MSGLLDRSMYHIGRGTGEFKYYCIYKEGLGEPLQ